MHEPGLVTLYGVFGVKAPRARRAELLAFANLFNAAFHQGTLMVRKDGRLVYRAACSYRKVKDLDEGYVASLLADMLDVPVPAPEPVPALPPSAAEPPLAPALPPSFVDVELHARTGTLSRATKVSPRFHNRPGSGVPGPMRTSEPYMFIVSQA